MDRRFSAHVGQKAASASPCDVIATDLLFPREYRLTCKRQFDHVFSTRAVRVRSGCLRAFAVPNKEIGPRLGLVIGKRQLKRAVDRNRVRRLLRESFRLRRATIPAMDIVIQLIETPLEMNLAAQATTLWQLLVSTIGKENAHRPLE